jgi:prefoldin subunit 5
MIIASTEIWIAVGGVFGGISTLIMGLGLAWRIAHTVGQVLSDISKSVASIEAKIEGMRADLHSIETWGHDHERRLAEVESKIRYCERVHE